jgi:TonB family protein
LKREVTHPETIVKGDQLDRPLRIVSQKAPIFPSAQKKKSRSGRATVEFLIDEKGNVALPRIISSDAPEFGYAAVQAVSTWQFDPPTANGKAVITRARVPFDFKFSPHSTAHSK